MTKAALHPDHAFSVELEVGQRPKTVVHELAFHKDGRYFDVGLQGDRKQAGTWKVVDGQITTSNHNLLQPILQVCYEQYINKLIMDERYD